MGGQTAVRGVVAIRSSAKHPHPIDRFFIGPALLIFGLALHTGLLLLGSIISQSQKPADIGTFLGLFAYGVVANLFLLLGCERIVGGKPWIDRIRRRWLAQLVTWGVLVVLTILVIVIFFI